jgi:NDP-sugar pyrophosphorylase family protein
MSKRAVILAGGKGTRLKPYTVVFPKPLMPVGDFPILEIIIRQLVRQDFAHITIAVNHQAELIQTFFGVGSKWGIKIDYSLEDQPLSTMGPLKLIENLPNDFLVMNGDVLTNLNYEKFYSDHVREGNKFTISSHFRDNRIDYGVLEIDSEKKLTSFQEKPNSKYLVSMGIYMINKTILETIPENTQYGFDTLMFDLISQNVEVDVKIFEGYWLDIGRPEDYAQAIEEFEKNKTLFLQE